MRFQGQQVAIRGIQIDTYQHRLVSLEQLIVAARPPPGQVLPGVNPARLEHHLRDDVVHRAERDRLIQQVSEKPDHPPKRTVAQQHQPQHHLPQPGLGHRQVEQHIVIRRDRRLKGLLQRLLPLLGLAFRETSG